MKESKEPIYIEMRSGKKTISIDVMFTNVCD